MIALASSGSRSSINSVDPLMSANSAVTVFRSPARFSAEGASTIRSGAIFDFFDASADDAPRAVPHFLQNRASGLTATLHPGHKSSSFDPHCSQKAASAGLSVLQFEQSIILGAQFGEESICVLEVGGVEAFGEPVVDSREHRARPAATTLIVQQPR